MTNEAGHIAASWEEMTTSIRENPGVDHAVIKEAIAMARERGGGTIPVSGYDIKRAKEKLTGEADAITQAEARGRLAGIREALDVMEMCCEPCPGCNEGVNALLSLIPGESA